MRYHTGDGKRRTKFFASQEEAAIYARARDRELYQYGQQALNLPDRVRHEALWGMELLAPYGPEHSLVDAVRFYIGHLEKNRRTGPIEDVIDKFLWDKEQQQLSPTHLYDLKKRLERFAQAFPGRMVNSFEPQEIAEWLHGLRVEPQTKKNYQRVLHSFFGYAVRRKYADRNPVAETPKIRVPEHEVVIYPAEELQRLLVHADPALIPYLVLGAFAGIRRAELLRLKWEDVRFGNGDIYIGSKIAKTRSKRIIPMAENLRLWLLPYASKEGPIVPDEWRLRILIEDACDKAGVKWQHNGLRHSFGTYNIESVPCTYAHAVIKRSSVWNPRSQ